MVFERNNIQKFKVTNLGKYCILIFILIAFLLPIALHSNETYRVYLIDKGPEKFEAGSDIFDATLKIHNRRCKSRRAKVFDADSLFTIADAPLYNPYIDSLINLNAEVLLKLRWSNYAVVRCDSSAAEAISKLSFVSNITETGQKLAITNNLYEIEPDAFDLIASDDYTYMNCGVFDYGDSYRQALVPNVPELHRLGVTGRGVLIGLIDSGFRWRRHTALANSNVIAEYDFIFNDSLTENQSGDHPNQDHHGTVVLSTIAGYAPGNLIGIAPNAEFILAKTEVIGSETRIEEDNFAAALEWMESRGVDIVNSSLGYYRYDSTEAVYSYGELDGNTTIVARVSNHAVRRGVLCITSAGNRGQPRTILSPADADSIIAVASVRSDGITVSGFSSKGPRGDGRIKPDLSAMGERVTIVNPRDSAGYIKSGGTSLSSPIITGGAALLLSLYPELRPWEIRKILFETGTSSMQPNNNVGYGTPDVYESAAKAGTIVAPISTYRIKSFVRVVTFIIPDITFPEVLLFVKFDGAIGYEQYSFYSTSVPGQYSASIPIGLFNDKPAEAYLIVNSLSQRRIPFDEGEVLVIDPTKDNIQCGVDASLFPVAGEGSASAYLSPSAIYGTINVAVLNIPIYGNDNVEYGIYSSVGRLVYSKNIPFRSKGFISETINVASYASGAYYIRVENGSNIEIIPFVVVR